MSRSRFISEKTHDTPPKFTAVQRKRHLYIDRAFEEEVLKNIRGKNNKVFCSLSYAYFKTSFQFFDKAFAKDLKSLSKKFGVTQVLDWSNYRADTKKRYQEQILSFLGYKSFKTPESKNKTKLIIEKYARVKKSFRECFLLLATELHKEKIEIPSYNTLKILIEDHYAQHQNELISIVDQSLEQNDKNLIDQLFDKTNQESAKVGKYRLTLLKRFSQSTKPMQIAKNIESYDILYELFLIAFPIIAKLDLNNEGIKYFANSVKKKQIFQTQRRQDSSRYLHLLAFVTHQFYLLHDTLVAILFSAVKNTYNRADKKAKDHYYKVRNEQSKNTIKLVETAEDMAKAMENIKSILLDPLIDDSVKIQQALQILNPKSEPNAVSQVIENVKDDLDKMTGEALFYHYLEEGSIALQRRCNQIVQRLLINEQSDNKQLLTAVNRFKKYKGTVDNRFPVNFLTKEEKKYIDTLDQFKSRIYKVVFFEHIVYSIKGDSLSLEHSYRYRRLDDYQITRKYFKENYWKLLAQADMSHMSDFNKVINEWDLELDKQFKETNGHILNGSNDFAVMDGLAGYKLTSQRNTSNSIIELDLDTPELFPLDSTVTISEVLNTVHQATGFLNEFQHHDDKYLKKRPTDKVFIATISGLGLHFNLDRFTKLSPDINDSVLVTTMNKYLSVENACLASNSIINYSKSMAVSELYVNDEFGEQTSSDGQKWSVAYESLNANYSFKYGGKDLILSEYNFIDSRHLFFYSDVISGAEREAHYMIDGVLNNDVVKSDMHSTDTHGFCEMAYGLCPFFKIAFAPRYKNIKKQNIYSLKTKRSYTSLKYPILPEAKIQLKLIEPHWEDILRLAVSVKLGKTTVSQIFKRLNSYSIKSNPLYKAIKEFGRIPKSHYILRFIDDPELRRVVTKQLNKGESGNKLSRALAIGRSDYYQVLQDEQQTVESCKRVIKNAIVCWNYMYLTQKLSNTKSTAEKLAIIQKIKSSSPVSWKHFIIHGQFFFSDSCMKDSRGFDFSKMHDPDILKT